MIKNQETDQEKKKQAWQYSDLILPKFGLLKLKLIRMLFMTNFFQ